MKDYGISLINCSFNSQNFRTARKISERIPHLSAASSLPKKFLITDAMNLIVF